MNSGSNVWRKQITQDDGFIQLRTFRNYVLVFTHTTIQVFSASKGELLLSINEESEIIDANVYESEVTEKGKAPVVVPTVIAALKNEPAAIYQNAKKVHSLDKQFTAIGVTLNQVYGLFEQKDHYSVYSIDHRTGTSKKIGGDADVKRNPHMMYKSNSNGFYIVSAKGMAIQQVKKLDYTGSDSELSFPAGSTTCCVRTNEFKAFLSKNKGAGLGKLFL